MTRKSRIDLTVDRTDRLDSIITAGTETSNEVIFRTRLDMQQVCRLISRTLVPAFD